MTAEDFYYLDYDAVEAINQAFCGEGAGIREPQGVDGIIGRPQQCFFGVEQFPGLFMKAAALLHGFATTQYFTDGNKRTGFLSATVFLDCNGYYWAGPDVDEAEVYLLRVADNIEDVADVAEWLERWSILRDEDQEAGHSLGTNSDDDGSPQ